MSSRKRDVVLAPEAREDEEDLLSYSVQTWGEQAAAAYEAGLNRVFDQLAAFPELGRARDDLCPGCRSLRVRQHVIVYRVEAATVQVVRILHVKRDIAREFRR